MKCIFCGQEHPEEIRAVEETYTYKGEEIHFLSENEYCPILDEYWQNEDQFNKSCAAMRAEMERIKRKEAGEREEQENNSWKDRMLNTFLGGKT